MKNSGSELVAASLLKRILRGEWEIGERIPSVDHLEKVFPVSRVTISKGIQKLCRQGYLHSAWRSGTFVRSIEPIRRILLHVGGDLGVIRTYPFSMVVTRKLEELLTQNGMQAEIHWEARQPLAGSRLAADLTDDRFEGIISVQSNLPAWIENDLPTLLGRLPIVHVGIHHNVPWVFVDMVAFNRHALAHCRQMGYRNAFYFSPPDSSTEGFTETGAMEVHGWSPSDGDWPQEPTEDRAYALFLAAWSRLNGKVDAVIVPDDVLAKGIVQALLSLGADVANRVEVIALTNKDSGLFYPLAVRAIEIDTNEVAQHAVALLADQFTHGVRKTSSGIAVAPCPVEEFHTTLHTQETC